MRLFVRGTSSSFLLLLTVVLTGCGGTPDSGISSHLSGQITVSSEVDSTNDNSGFSVVIASLIDDRVDTLGVGVTSRDGRFVMDIQAPDKGVYPITIRRHGGMLKQGQIVVVDGDSATLSLKLPTGRPITIRSAENGAWMAYRNTKAAHAANVRRMAGTGSIDAGALRTSVVQTANVLWNLADTYPATLGAGLGRLESVVMLSSWDDSLVVSRLRELPLEAPGIVGAVRAGWRSVQRISGLDSALAMIDSFNSRLADPESRAALRAERVVALMDGGRVDQARVEAQELAATKAGSPEGSSGWTKWGEAALYEIDHLRPGLAAPSFEAIARDGSRFDLSKLRSRVVLLEFYVPENEEYQQDLPIRSRLSDIADGAAFQVVSISLQPDPDLNDAFIDSRNLPGVHIVAEGGATGELARLYNVSSVPKRFLLHNGKIVSKYHGRALGAAVDDAVAILDRPS